MTPLRRLRLARNLNQEALESIGLDQAVVSRIERSRRTRAEPTLPGATAEHAAKLARFFGHAITETEILYPGDYMLPGDDALDNQEPVEERAALL